MKRTKSILKLGLASALAIGTFSAGLAGFNHLHLSAATGGVQTLPAVERSTILSGIQAPEGFNQPNLHIMERGRHGDTLPTHYLSAQDAAQVAAMYVWNVFGDNLDGRHVAMFLDSGAESDRSAWRITVMGDGRVMVYDETAALEAEGLTRDSEAWQARMNQVRGNPALEAQDPYVIIIDAITGEWLGISRINYQHPLRSEGVWAEDIMDAIRNRDRALAAGEADPMDTFEPDPLQLAHFEQTAMHHAIRHFGLDTTYIGPDAALDMDIAVEYLGAQPVASYVRNAAGHIVFGNHMLSFRVSGEAYRAYVQVSAASGQVISIAAESGVFSVAGLPLDVDRLAVLDDWVAPHPTRDADGQNPEEWIPSHTAPYLAMPPMPAPPSSAPPLSPPGNEAPSDDEPTTAEPATEEPTAGAPAADEPTPATPADVPTGEPADDEPTAPTSAAETSITQRNLDVSIVRTLGNPPETYAGALSAQAAAQQAAQVIYNVFEYDINGMAVEMVFLGTAIQHGRGPESISQNPSWQGTVLAGPRAVFQGDGSIHSREAFVPTREYYAFTIDAITGEVTSIRRLSATAPAMTPGVNATQHAPPSERTPAERPADAAPAHRTNDADGWARPDPIDAPVFENPRSMPPTQEFGAVLTDYVTRIAPGAAVTGLSYQHSTPRGFMRDANSAPVATGFHMYFEVTFTAGGATRVANISLEADTGELVWIFVRP